MTRGLGGYEQIGSAKGIKRIPKKKTKKKVSKILLISTGRCQNSREIYRR